MGRKRKSELQQQYANGEIPVQRNAANERERDRMRVLSKAFTKLKTTLPWVPPDTKLSKLDTLRLATCYIAHLRQILAEEEENEVTFSKLNGELSPGNMHTCRLVIEDNVNIINTDFSQQRTTGRSSCNKNNENAGFDNRLNIRGGGTRSLHSSNDSITNTNSIDITTGSVHPKNLTWPYSFSNKFSTMPDFTSSLPYASLSTGN